MTNLIASLLITVSTNWTGATDGKREVGLIFTNYEAQCVFENKTNLMLLDKRYADTVAWRPKQVQTIKVATNTLSIPFPYQYQIMPGWGYTNVMIGL